MSISASERGKALRRRRRLGQRFLTIRLAEHEVDRLVATHCGVSFALTMDAPLPRNSRSAEGATATSCTYEVQSAWDAEVSWPRRLLTSARWPAVANTTHWHKFVPDIKPNDVKSMEDDGMCL